MTRLHFLAVLRSIIMVGTHLHCGNDSSSSGLEHIFIDPIWMLGLNKGSLNVMPTIEDHTQSQQSRILVHTRIAQN